MARALIDYLDPEAMLLGVEAADSDAIIRQLAGRLQSRGYVRETFADAVLAREAAMPTGLPLGEEGNVAVPHTDPIHVIKPGVAVATLVQPVLFSNMEDPDDRLKVDVVFLMALNDKDRQIEMLQEIAGAIQSPETLAELRRAKSVEDVSRLLA